MGNTLFALVFIDWGYTGRNVSAQSDRQDCAIQSSRTSDANDRTEQGRMAYIYIDPHYITENNNGDVVVADFDYELCDLVVTDGGGNDRFSYIGPPFGPRLEPHGVCTDALSHILVCDSGTNTVQIIDRDGQFLSHLLIRPAGIFKLVSLRYDFNTHRLWVGSWYNNKVCVYRYITSDDVMTGKTIIR